MLDMNITQLDVTCSNQALKINDVGTVKYQL